MTDFTPQIAAELSIPATSVASALKLLAEGATIPFIARYRKEVTGALDEVQLRDIADRNDYLTELADRKKAILASIEEQGKMTDELRAKIEACSQKTELEDLYLPYKPKRRTRATIAAEKGLTPLAELFRDFNAKGQSPASLEELAAPFINAELGVNTVEDALAGASDILAEQIAESAEIRASVREYISRNGVVTSSIKPEFPEGSTKYEMYRSFTVPLHEAAPHHILALRRGEREEILVFDVDFDDQQAASLVNSAANRAPAASPLATFLATTCSDAYKRLMKSSLLTDVRLDRKEYADKESAQTFASNVRTVLLSSPAGMRPTIGIDPGFRTGCKLAVVDSTGKFVKYEQIFPHNSERERSRAADTLRGLIREFGAELLAIGNGTAGRETEEFVRETIKDLPSPPIAVIVNESGASIYSASDVARDEFPELDLTVRGAISIARRLQDPLAELVKIDPKSIGVGQYQHDIDQKLLRDKLDAVVESCVNYVGVDVNLASKELLQRVSGITSSLARNIVQHRNLNGAFRTRQELKKVSRLGDKAFEQCAGFLRIRDGENPLDYTAVHPESYDIAKRILDDLGIDPKESGKHADQLARVDIAKYVTPTAGEPTIRDIIAELQKPGRDPREVFRYARFDEKIKEIKDLRPGMVLEGIITNVANFGAFVDIGVHQDGLVHVSQLANRFVNNPHDVVKPGQIVRVKVLEVNESLKRISLSMKLDETSAAHPTSKPKPKEKHQDSSTSMEDSLKALKARFAKK